MNVSAFLSPPLRGLLGKLRENLARATRGHRDEEAVHDLRVAIRRLRSLLKPARHVYGDFHTSHVRDALKAIADATGELRDEEVLMQTIGGLPLPLPLRRDRAAWLRLRQARESELRAALLGLLRSGRGEQAAAALDALLTLPVDPRHDPPVGPFAARVVARAAHRVAAHQNVGLEDVHGLHELRILYKRLRYAAEGFAAALSTDDAALATVAERFQKRLGELHDIDVASEIVSADLAMTPTLREALLSALKQARVRHLDLFVQARDQHAQPDDADKAKAEDRAAMQSWNLAASQPAAPKTPARKAPAGKASARKTPARKTPARKTPARKTPARKTPARKGTKQ